MKIMILNRNGIVADSLIYPLEIKKYLVLLLLFSTSFLIIPGVMACGYLFRIINYTIHGYEEHPDFKNWKNLLADGLKFLGLVLIFGIVFYGLLWIIKSQSVGVNNFSFLFIAAIYTSLANALFVMCLAHMAYENRFTAAFEFKNIFGFIQEVGWVKYLALIIIMTLIGGLINFLLELISPLLTLLGIGGFPGLVAVTLIAYTYLFSFESRYTGLLYPKKT